MPSPSFSANEFSHEYVSAALITEFIACQVGMYEFVVHDERKSLPVPSFVVSFRRSPLVHGLAVDGSTNDLTRRYKNYGTKLRRNKIRF